MATFINISQNISDYPADIIAKARAMCEETFETFSESMVCNFAYDIMNPVAPVKSKSRKPSKLTQREKNDVAYMRQHNSPSSLQR